MNQEINIKDYSYDLPAERIALFPLDQRDYSKLLVYRSGAITHDRFHNLADHIPANSLLFFNNTKVIQARLLFRKETGASIEIFLLHPVSPSRLLLQTMQAQGTCEWVCTIGNLRRWKNDSVLTTRFEGIELTAELTEPEHGVVRFTWSAGLTFAEVIATIGKTPLPPYLKRDVTESDKERYQTIYSKAEGAVAAPTAGLHFTDTVFQSLEKKFCITDFLTLHVSAGTFQPVKATNAAEHPMHEEQIIISRTNIENILRKKGLVIPVGTTSMRTLESLYWYGVKLTNQPGCPFRVDQRDPYTQTTSVSSELSMQAVLKEMDRQKVDTLTGETSIYIMPGYTFRVCNGLVTNFHQPESTLMLLVAALIGPSWKTVYEEAMQSDYRFLSYGDSSLLLP